MGQTPAPFWSVPVEDLLKQLDASAQGLTGEQAHDRLERFGANLLRPKKRTDSLTLLLGQFKSPIILILLFAASLSLFVKDAPDALIIFAIILVSGLLGFWQERGATDAVQKLLAMVRVDATVLRDGHTQDIPLEDVVPGDVVLLSAGAAIPGDCRLLDAKDLFVDEAALTGETYPVEKMAGQIAAETPLAQRTNVLYMGTHVVSGSASALVVKTGIATEFGAVSQRLKLRAPETDFERGVRRFGYLLMEITLILVIAIFAINVYFKRPVLDAFLFSLALAVGLTPQLLPAIISINLSHGAKRMAKAHVIVKRLASIENFGSMSILCSDKTGTLTEGIVHLRSALDIDGQPSDKVFLYAYLNAHYQTGYTNPIDQAVLAFGTPDIAAYQKRDEVPYDFFRRRLSVVVQNGDAVLMVTKGALQSILEVCTTVENAAGEIVPLASVRGHVQQQFEDLSGQGFRTLGIAYRRLDRFTPIRKENEVEMTFLGFLVLFDPPKEGIVQTIEHLRQLGIGLKIITGDNRLVAASVGKQVGLPEPRILTGPDLRHMSDEALMVRLRDADLFAEVEPNQKERIILAFKKSGYVVGYIGDGINDASALHAADVGISVNTAVDVAKDAADIVLLENNLNVLLAGVREGRMTFANTLKYIFMATSANFGNMFSMAGASLFMSFLPLLPKQILLMNLLTDFPEMTIASDTVDPEMVDQPRRWDIGFIRRFMLVFGVLSSVFDYATFGVLLLLLNAKDKEFRTGWFLESVVSATLIVLVIRTRRHFYQSKPGRPLLIATLIVIAVTVLIPFSSLDRVFGFKQLPAVFLVLVTLIIVAYVASAEAAKRAFFRRTARLSRENSWRLR
jgi:Mg2+-importing ATPase